MDLAEHKRIQALKLQWREYMLAHPHLCHDCQFDPAECGAKPKKLKDLSKKEKLAFAEVIPKRNAERVLLCEKYQVFRVEPPAP